MPAVAESPLVTGLGHDGTKEGASAFERQARLLQTGRNSPANGASLGSIAQRLQQTYGNQYVQRLATSSSDAASLARPVQAARGEDERGDDYPVSRETAARIEAQRSHGRPLEPDTRSEMEASLGTGLRDVRLHDDAEAYQLSHAVNARAFTSGRDVFMGSGADGPMARQVLAHELAHAAYGKETPGAVQRYDPETEDQMQDVGPSGSLDNGGTTGYEEPPQEDEVDGTTGGVNAPPDDEYTDELSQRDLADEQLVELIDAGQKGLVQYVDGTDLSDEERFRMLEVAVAQRSRPAIVSLWLSFDDIEGTAAANPNLWLGSVGVTTELFNLPGMSEIRDLFKADVTRIRDTSLQKSGEAANQEWERYGISGDREGNPDVAVEQQEQLQSLQAAASLVAAALAAQEEMRKVPIAYRAATPGLEEEGAIDRGEGEPDDFDPAVGFAEAPDIPIMFDPLFEIDAGVDSDYSPGEASWFELYDLYESSAQIIAYWSEQYPALYAVIKDGMGSASMVDKLGMYADQQQALKTLEAALLDVLIDIHLTEAADIDPLDLKAIHERLYAGGHGLSVSKPWENLFYSSIGKHLVQAHENTDWWTAAGVTLFAATAIVTFAFPGAFLALAMIGGTSAAVGVAEAAVRFEKADELARAADASMRREWELVHKDQSQVEETKAKIALIFSALDIIGIGRDVRAMSAAGAAMHVSEDLLPASAKAEDASLAAEGGAKGAVDVVDAQDAAKTSDAGDAASRAKAEDEIPGLPGASGVKTPPGTGSDLTFYQIVERMEAHVNAENIGLQEALKVGDREYLELIGMREGQIAILLNPSHPFFAAQYGNAMESAVAGAFRADSDLAELIIDARRTSGAIFPPGRKPDFGFGDGPAQGHIIDLTTSKEAAKKAPKYHDRVIVLTYNRL